MFSYDLLLAAPNSAIDSYYELDKFQLEKVNKAVYSFHTAGGKGFNAARALNRLGGKALSIGIVAGKTGEFIEEDLKNEGILHDLVWGEGESRRCVTIRFPDSLDTTVILENGSLVGNNVIENFRTNIISHAHEAPFTALVGSLPEGFPVDFYKEIIFELKRKDVRVCIDCSGKTLQKAVEASPWMIKINLEEFQSAFFENSDKVLWQDVQNTYLDLYARGVEILIITDGQKGAYVLSPNQDLIHVSTEVKNVVSSAGSGDTFLAAFLLEFERENSIKKAAIYASAASAANLLELGCGFFQLDVVDKLLATTRIDDIPWS